MAVDAFKDNPFSIQCHDVVFHFKAAESNSLWNQFLHRSILCGHFQQKIIQHRCFRRPQFWMIHLQNKLCFTMQHTFRTLQYSSILRQRKLYVSFSDRFCINDKICPGKRIIQQSLYFQVRNMYIWNRIQIDIPVNTGKAEEVLIFAPAAACPLEYLRRQFVFSLFQVRCQFKLGRRKGILAITDKSSVQPYGNAALCSLERNKKSFSLHLFRHFKIFHIGSRRVEALRNLARLDFFSSFPWVLHVSILRCVVTLHLDMRRHTDIIPCSAVIFRCFKSRNRALIVFCIVKFPQSIQTVPEVFHLLLHFFHRTIVSVVRMCRHTVFSKVCRILDFFILKHTHFYCPPFLLLLF